jgi:hypothetical protein
MVGRDKKVPEVDVPLLLTGGVLLHLLQELLNVSYPF